MLETDRKTPLRSRQQTAALVAANQLVVVGSFLPWVISGTAHRDSYATIRAARSIGVVSNAPWETLLPVWFLVPLLAAFMLVGIVFGKRRLVSGAAIPLGAIAIVVSTLVLVAPIERGVGPAITFIGAVGLLAATSWTILKRRRHP